MCTLYFSNFFFRKKMLACRYLFHNFDKHEVYWNYEKSLQSLKDDFHHGDVLFLHVSTSQINLWKANFFERKLF